MSCLYHSHKKRRDNELTMKKRAKLKEELTCRFKIDIRTLMNLNRTLEDLKNLHFNGLSLTKAYNV